MTKFKVFTLHSDSQNSWIAVSRAFLIQLDILTKISLNSYQSKTGSTVYVDYADKDLLEQACKKAKVEYILNPASSKKCKVRSYPSFELTRTDLMKSIAHKKHLPIKEVKLAHVESDDLIGLPEFYD